MPTPALGRTVVRSRILAEPGVAARRDRKMAAKHTGKGAWAGIPEIKGNTRHFLSFGEPGQRAEKSCLTAPGTEAHAGLAPEQPGEGATARADLTAPGSKRGPEGRRADDGTATRRETL